MRSLLAVPILGSLALCLVGAPHPARADGPPQGQLVAWGNDVYGQVSNAPAGSDFVAVSGGGYHFIALRADGSLASWGFDEFGEVANTPTGTGFTAVSAGLRHSVALRSDGSLASWGGDAYGEVTGTPTGTGFVAVSAGSQYSVALKSDGSLLSWGSDAYGQVSGTPTGTGFKSVVAGDYFSLAVRADGGIVFWGVDVSTYSGVFNELPWETGFVAVAAAAGYPNEAAVALRADGSLLVWGDFTSGVRFTAPAGTGFVSVDGDTSYNGDLAVALRADGTLVAWGTDYSSSISGAPAGAGFIAVAAGYQCGVAIKSLPPTPIEQAQQQLTALTSAVSADLAASGAADYVRALDRVQQAISAGNVQSAAGQLNGLIHRFDVLGRQGRLTSAQAANLIAAARAIRQLLGG